jgi:hypothetical protein
MTMQKKEGAAESPVEKRRQKLQREGKAHDTSSIQTSARNPTGGIRGGLF